jgi:hypothetical protein
LGFLFERCKYSDFKKVPAYRDVTRLKTPAQAKLGRGLSPGLRFDYFRFDVEDRFVPQNSGLEGASRFQPKANISYTPSNRLPVTLYASYGRGISSQDARGVVRKEPAHSGIIDASG